MKTKEKHVLFEDWWASEKMPDIDMSSRNMGNNRPHAFELKRRDEGLWVSEDVLYTSLFQRAQKSIGRLTFRRLLREKGLEVTRLRNNRKGPMWEYSGVFVRLRDIRTDDIELWEVA